MTLCPVIVQEQYGHVQIPQSQTPGIQERAIELAVLLVLRMNKRVPHLRYGVGAVQPVPLLGRSEEFHRFGRDINGDTNRRKQQPKSIGRPQVSEPLGCNESFGLDHEFVGKSLDSGLCDDDSGLDA